MLVIVIFLLPSVKVGSSPSVNVDAMVFIFSLPSVKGSMSLAMNVDDCYLFSTFSECW